MHSDILFGWACIVLACAVATGQGDVCASFGHLCGKANCTVHNEGKYFTCDCGANRYFNATAQRCYHIDACAATPCEQGLCLDNDGNDEAKCDCSDLDSLTPDCEVSPKFKEDCNNGGGQVRKNASGIPKCVCPHGTKHENGVCKSIACLFSKFKCKDICKDAKLREDDRCCQGWEFGLCNAHREEYCVPGTIAKGELCTNVCEADDIDPICEHECMHQKVCNCGRGQELSADGFTCTAKLACNKEEIANCEARGRRCLYEDNQVTCKCHEYSTEVEGACSERCTTGKKVECDTLLSKCAIISNQEKCTCDYPLEWSDATKECVLEKSFRYVVTIQLYQQTATANRDSWCRKQGELIDKAMKSLYGSTLRTTKIEKCGNKVDVQLVFTEEPPPALLNRIQQCENEDPTSGCYFVPSVYIVSGTASDPQTLDICRTYFSKMAAFGEKYECRNEGGGAYSLLCVRNGLKTFTEHGHLKIEICDDHSTTTESTTEASTEISFAEDNKAGNELTTANLVWIGVGCLAAAAIIIGGIIGIIKCVKMKKRTASRTPTENQNGRELQELQEYHMVPTQEN